MWGPGIPFVSGQGKVLLSLARTIPRSYNRSSRRSFTSLFTNTGFRIYAERISQCLHNVCVCSIVLQYLKKISLKSFKKDKYKVFLIKASQFPPGVSSSRAQWCHHCPLGSSQFQQPFLFKWKRFAENVTLRKENPKL